MITEPPLFVDRLCKSYHSGHSSIEVLRGVCLSVEEKEVVALSGASGSGKSTLLGLIAGLDVPDSGEVQVQGCRVHELSRSRSRRYRRTSVGLVFQRFNLLPTLTVQQNVELPLLARGKPARGEARALLEQLQLERKADNYPWQLSGGETQRAAIARALIHRPPLLLADEPSSNLDEAATEQVMSIMLDAISADATALLVATHDPRVARFADRVLYLRNGVIAESG